jgi:peptide/nickel transport system permease protein
VTGRRKIAAALAFIAAIHIAALLAGVLAPYPYDEQHRDFPLAPPSRVHFIDAAGHFHARPFVYAIAPDSAGGYREDAARSYDIQFFPGNGRLFGIAPPGLLFLTGADAYGRDIFSRLLYGARVSLFTGLLAASLSMGIGALLGIVAGFYSGWIDQLLMRAGELAMALPWFYLLLAVRAALPLYIDGWRAFLLVIAIIGGIGWARPARVVRSVAMSARGADYVLAAEGFGAPPGYIMRRHILPAILGVALTQATVLIPQYILAELGLSFLGLGVGEPIPTWGNMLADAIHEPLLQFPWLATPGMAAIPVLLAYLTLAEALGDGH